MVKVEDTCTYAMNGFYESGVIVHHLVGSYMWVFHASDRRWLVDARCSVYDTGSAGVL